MSREVNVPRLLATTMLALTVALSSSTASNANTNTNNAPSSFAMAAKVSKGGKKGGSSGGGGEDDNGQPSRIPHTLPNGAPIKMPEVDTLSVSLPFSLKRNMGLTNITDVLQSFSAGALCNDPSSASTSSAPCDAVTGGPEASLRSKRPFHEDSLPSSSSSSSAEEDGNPPPTLQHILETTDETFLLYFYDSLDANSYRYAPFVDQAAGLLKGYVTTVGIDIRRDDLQWIINSWNIQLAPSLRLLRPTRMMSTSRQGLSSTEAVQSTIAATGSHLLNNLNAALSPPYSLFAGAKAPIDIAANGNQMQMLKQDAWSVEAIRKFALGGGKSLESENTIETLTAGDNAAETVYDVLRGAHPLTYTSRKLLSSSVDEKKNSGVTGFVKSLVKKGSEALSPSSAPLTTAAFTAGMLSSPFYSARAQVPKAVIILFTDKDNALANLFKAVALRYNNRAVLITVNGKEKAPKLAKAFGVTSFPTFAVVKPPQSALSHTEMFESLTTGAFSKKRDGNKDVFELIDDLLKKQSDDGNANDSGNLRLYSPPEGATISIRDVMQFLDAKPKTSSAADNSNMTAAAISLSGIIPSTVLHTLQREATRDAFHYQQLRATNLITPIATKRDWFNLVSMNAGIVASGPFVANPKTAPTVSIGLLFTPSSASGSGSVSDIIRQEISDVKGRLKDNYFVSIPKTEATKATLEFFKQKCVMASEKKKKEESGSSEAIDAISTDVVFLYAKLLPLHASAAAGLSAAAASAAFAPNFIIDYSCRTAATPEENSAILGSAMKLDRMVHYGAKKGFLGYGGSEELPPSFDWSEVPVPQLSQQ